MSYQSINPFNGEPVKTFDGLTEPQLESAIATTAKCFEKWRALTFAERAAIVARAADIMRERAADFARPVTLVMGKLFTESIGEVMLSADILDYYGGIKNSGYGRELSSLGIQEIVNKKLVRISPIDAPA